MVSVRSDCLDRAVRREDSVLIPAPLSGLPLRASTNGVRLMIRFDPIRIASTATEMASDARTDSGSSVNSIRLRRSPVPTDSRPLGTNHLALVTVPRRRCTLTFTMIERSAGVR